MDSTRSMDNKGMFGGLRKGEKECIKPRAGDADLWTNLEEFRESVKRRNLGGSGTCEGTPHKEGKIKI